ncbi:MAG: hypothetical protein H7X89_08065 [Rhizobiales bacterium]|nr:hypothetical protein [Hyphomicrobiales bacterium]
MSALDSAAGRAILMYLDIAPIFFINYNLLLTALIFLTFTRITKFNLPGIGVEFEVDKGHTIESWMVIILIFLVGEVLHIVGGLYIIIKMSVALVGLDRNELQKILHAITSSGHWLYRGFEGNRFEIVSPGYSGPRTYYSFTWPAYASAVWSFGVLVHSILVGALIYKSRLYLVYLTFSGYATIWVLGFCAVLTSMISYQVLSLPENIFKALSVSWR